LLIQQLLQIAIIISAFVLMIAALTGQELRSLRRLVASIIHKIGDIIKP